MLSPVELDPTMKMLMQVPLWAQRVINVQGSALKDGDLARCRQICQEIYQKRGKGQSHVSLSLCLCASIFPHLIKSFLNNLITVKAIYQLHHFRLSCNIRTWNHTDFLLHERVIDRQHPVTSWNIKKRTQYLHSRKNMLSIT